MDYICMYVKLNAFRNTNKYKPFLSIINTAVNTASLNRHLLHALLFFVTQRLQFSTSKRFRRE